MKSQLAFVLLQGGMAYLINTFFSGFVVGECRNIFASIGK